MSEVVVVASFTAQEGREDEAERLLRALIAPTHGDEGCLLYSLHRGTDDPRRFSIVERWTSRSALDAHLEDPDFQARAAPTREVLENADIVFYEALPEGESTRGSIAGHAAG
jgi:quinol monooxygenase YgiN